MSTTTTTTTFSISSSDYRAVEQGWWYCVLFAFVIYGGICLVKYATTLPQWRLMIQIGILSFCMVLLFNSRITLLLTFILQKLIKSFNISIVMIMLLQFVVSSLLIFCFFLQTNDDLKSQQQQQQHV
jgi:hypothetical protein